MDVRSNIFTQREKGHWHKLPRDVVDSQSLETFKARSDGTLGNLI